MLAAGLNPGFAMDALALMLTATCTGVRRVSVTRVEDAGTRRLPLQRRVGAGLNSAQFRRAVTEGTVQHVGLVESAYMIASCLGWKLDKVDETLEPADVEHSAVWVDSPFPNFGTDLLGHAPCRSGVCFVVLIRHDDLVVAADNMGESVGEDVGVHRC